MDWKSDCKVGMGQRALAMSSVGMSVGYGMGCEAHKFSSLFAFSDSDSFQTDQIIKKMICYGRHGKNVIFLEQKSA